MQILLFSQVAPDGFPGQWHLPASCDISFCALGAASSFSVTMCQNNKILSAYLACPA